MPRILNSQEHPPWPSRPPIKTFTSLGPSAITWTPRTRTGAVWSPTCPLPSLPCGSESGLYLKHWTVRVPRTGLLCHEPGQTPSPATEKQSSDVIALPVQGHPPPAYPEGLSGQTRARAELHVPGAVTQLPCEAGRRPAVQIEKPRQPRGVHFTRRRPGLGTSGGPEALLLQAWCWSPAWPLSAAQS